MHQTFAYRNEKSEAMNISDVLEILRIIPKMSEAFIVFTWHKVLLQTRFSTSKKRFELTNDTVDFLIFIK